MRNSAPASSMKRMSPVSRITSLSEWVLRQSVVWGGFAYLAFYALVVRTSEPGSPIDRYFNGHWVEHVTATMFCVGIAALLIKVGGLGLQMAGLARQRLPHPPVDGQLVEDADQLLVHLDSTGAGRHDGYLTRRLRDALEYVRQRGSADSLETHLRHLEDVDLGRMHHSYATVRIIVATIPIMGFLGTVIGITMAIAKLSAGDMEKSLGEVIQGLSVAFDTTALALSLSIILLFAKFLVERLEVQLLTSVDRLVGGQLLGRFREYGTTHDPHVASIKRISEQVLRSVESAADQQSELLNNSLTAATEQWAAMAETTGETLNDALATGLAQGLKTHASTLNEGVSKFAGQLEETLIRHAEILNEGLEQHSELLNQSVHETGDAFATTLERHCATVVEAEQQLSAENRKHLADVEGALGEAVLVSADRQQQIVEQTEQLVQEMRDALVEAAGTTVAQQEQLIKQGDVLLKVVEAIGQIRSLEDSLNANLRALSDAHHFEEAIVGLSATLQLVSAKLGHGGPQAARVDLEDDEPTSRAA